MKIIRSAIVVCIFLNFAFILVSSEDVSLILQELVAVDQEAYFTAWRAIYTQYGSVWKKSDADLQSTGQHRLIEISNNINNYIKDVKDQLSSAGYDPDSCLALVEGLANNVTSVFYKAVDQKLNVYDKTLNNIHSIGNANLEVITSEISSIVNEHDVCLSSESSSYCVGSLTQKIQQKKAEIPLLYQRETERSMVDLIQHGLLYKYRIQDYIDEATRNTQPYIAYLESCVQLLLTGGPVTKL